MRRSSIKSAAFGMALLALASVSHADWVAYNDHVPGVLGSQTHTNATTNNIRLQTSGPLKKYSHWNKPSGKPCDHAQRVGADLQR